MIAGWLMSPVHADDTSPLRWQDGYITWRHQLVKPTWQLFEATDSTKFALDVGHIGRERHSIVAYITGGDTFDPNESAISAPCPTTGLMHRSNADSCDHLVAGESPRGYQIS